jgi:5-methylcytosine-specific restriction protein A
MVRNPKWSRDEIILTLDFYFRHYPNIPEKHSDEIQKLSEELRLLTERLGHDLTDTYRNSNGVYMKLMNFHHLNDDHPGEGLKGASKLDGEVFSEFVGDKARLSEVAGAIGAWLSSTIQIDDEDIDDGEEYEVEEGRLLTRVHRTRERDRKIISKKKSAVLKSTGKLQCECCAFDFRAFYGDIGEGFVECHHKVPISTLSPGNLTSLNDLALVCSNCHRMIHRQRPWLSIEQMKLLVGLRD